MKKINNIYLYTVVEKTDFDRAYERYTFMKSLERDKEKQRRYEQIIRHEPVDDEAVLEDGQSSESDVSEDSDYLIWTVIQCKKTY